MQSLYTSQLEAEGGGKTRVTYLTPLGLSVSLNEITLHNLLYMSPANVSALVRRILLLYPSGLADWN